MSNKETNYGFWDEKQLISSFNSKTAKSFFRSETELLVHVQPSQLANVLDIGCSCGRFIELLDQQHFTGNFYGIDISAPSVDLCKKNYPQHRFDFINALDLDTKNQYELVNATGVIQHEVRYKELITKMVNLSSNYIMFDVKLADIAQPMVDIERCFCEVGGCKIHMVVFSLSHLLSLLQSITDVGSVWLYGYETPPNDETTRPDDINSWVSCGVLIKKGEPFSIASATLPGQIAQHIP